MGDVTRGAVENALLKTFGEVKGRRGFRYHSRPTNIYIYAYGSRTQALAGEGLWFAILEMSPLTDGKPRMQFRDSAMSSAGAPPVERFGLSRAKRQEIFRATVVAEDRAARGAEAQFPNDYLKQAGRSGSLAEKYRDEVARQYGISEAQLDSIGLEGITEKWVMGPVRE